MNFFNLWLGVALFLIPYQSYAQEKQTVFSGDYTNTPLKQILTNIEAKDGVVFYYEHKSLDTFNITASFNNEFLKNAIDIILDNVPIRFWVRNNQVSLFLDTGKILTPSRFTLSGVVRDNYEKVVPKPVVINVFMYTLQATGQQSKKVTLEFRKQITTNENGMYFIDKLK